MDAIRFAPSVSATFAIDHNPTGTGGDLFADMLGEHLKKQAASDQPEKLTRRRPKDDRPSLEEDRSATRRPGVVIKHAHDLRDVANTACDMTPPKDQQASLAAPADGSSACMDDPASTDQAPTDQAPTDQAWADEVTVEAVQDKDQQTDQQTGSQEPVLVSVQVAPEVPADVPAEVTNEAVAIVADPQAPALVDGQLVPAAETETAAITPAEPAPVDPQAGSTTNAGAQPEDEATQANFAATVAASLGDTMVGLVSSDAALDTAVSVETLASASLATLATPKAATPATPEAPQAVAVELAANITPEAPRPAAEVKARTATRAIPASEIKAQIAAAQNQASQANQAPQPPVAAQALAHAAPNAAFNETSADGFDTGFGPDGAGAPGWALHLAQGAATKRPDFIAQLRQHLQELPAHEQVAVNIQRALREGTNRLSIQLSPAELGKIHVKLEIDEEKRVTAAVTVEKPSTLELLQRDVKGLERALQEAGLKMDGSDLSFNLGRQDGKEFSQETGQSGTSGFGNGAGEAQAEGDVPADQAVAQVDTAAGLVNVQI